MGFIALLVVLALLVFWLIGAYNKLFHGTWVEGGQKGDFTLTRN